MGGLVVVVPFLLTAVYGILVDQEEKLQKELNKMDRRER